MIYKRFSSMKHIMKGKFGEMEWKYDFKEGKEH